MCLSTSRKTVRINGKKGARQSWIFSSLTFLSVAHLVDSIYALISGAESRLLTIYPFIGEKLSTMLPIHYVSVSALVSLLCWG